MTEQEDERHLHLAERAHETDRGERESREPAARSHRRHHPDPERAPPCRQRRDDLPWLAPEKPAAEQHGLHDIGHHQGIDRLDDRMPAMEREVGPFDQHRDEGEAKPGAEPAQGRRLECRPQQAAETQAMPGEREREHADDPDQDAEPGGEAEPLAGDQPGDERGLHPLGLGIGAADGEAAKAEGKDEEAGADDLQGAGERAFGQKRRVRRRKMRSARRQHGNENREPERHAVEESHERRPVHRQHGAEPLLQRRPPGLKQRRDQGEDDPERHHAGPEGKAGLRWAKGGEAAGDGITGPWLKAPPSTAGTTQTRGEPIRVKRGENT